MTEYKIIHDGLKGYGVEVSSPGRFLSVRGFVTELDAAAWIADNRPVRLRWQRQLTH